MGNARTVSGELLRACQSRPPSLLVDLGAGDGRFLLSVARHLSPKWPRLGVLLVDKQPVPLDGLATRFAALDWQAEALQADVLDLPEAPHWPLDTAAMANLFLHHFTEEALSKLFAQFARRVRVLVAVEPRRSGVALAASRLVGLIGCNRVTRHDAPVSVRAGFSGRELSPLWPRDAHWRLHEARAGFFSHVFAASRRE